MDFTKEKESWEMSAHEKLEAAEKSKVAGNDLFKIGKFQRAANKYNKALNYVNEDGHFEDEPEKLIKTLRVSCWLNHAACCLKLKDFTQAISLCSKVLEIESCNVKALYRIAQAYGELYDLELAKTDVLKALELDPNNNFRWSVTRWTQRSMQTGSIEQQKNPMWCQRSARLKMQVTIKKQRALTRRKQRKWSKSCSSKLVIYTTIMKIT
ncbi:peptidyl-prolyl cis-trans isomerase FKBP62-like [Miscanthus floridulus]|uniref:peptidyl-prolyl cis-trans isomerase FKBP62-like n=1 Tax=Miscanthus floridulus TaxID=154761 RepID=UPI003457496B